MVGSENHAEDDAAKATLKLLRDRETNTKGPISGRVGPQSPAVKKCERCCTSLSVKRRVV